MTRRTAQLLSDGSSSFLPSGITVAEASRPHRAVGRDQAALREKPRKRQQVQEDTDSAPKTPKSATLTDWFTPLLWTTIAAAARIAGPNMSPREIVREIKRNHNAGGLFDGLTEQVLGRMIIREKGKRPRWSDKTLKKVQLGRGARGNVTRARILVSTVFCIFTTMG